MSDNWVVQNLENALETWNEKLAEIWQLITTSPQDFKGGGIWGVIVNINGAVQAGNRSCTSRAVLCCRRRQDVRQLFGSQETRTRSETVYQVRSCKGSNHLWNGIDACDF